MVLIFAICAGIRLARFNVDLHDDSIDPVIEKYFFKGIPSPVGAALTMLPMVLFYEFGEGFYCNQVLVIAFVVLLAIMMASRVPTISIKKIPIKNSKRFLTSLILGSIIFGLIFKPWLSLAIIGIVYVFSIAFTIYFFIKISNQSKIKIKK
jgi:CDP-diacylglycerol--serine O-phosphatidyltransferase